MGVIEKDDDLLEHVKRDGYVVIQDCLPRDFTRRLHAEFMQLMSKKVRRFGLATVRPTDGRDLGNDGKQIDFRPEGGNHDLNRWNMHLPSTPSFLDERLIAHPRVLGVMDALLGPDCAAILLGSDTPYPDAGFQSVHQDFHRFGFTVNISLVDSTMEMAPLELWPGSHLSISARRRGDYNTDRLWLSKRRIEEVVYGRIVDEMSGSDRDARRAIPDDSWRSFSPRMKHLLRYASVDAPRDPSGHIKRSWLGSSILCAASLGIMGAGLYLDVHSKVRKATIR